VTPFDPDGDQVVDLVLCSAGLVYYYANDGKAGFHEVPGVFVRRVGTLWSAEVGDTDGDGDLDVVVYNWGVGWEPHNWGGAWVYANLQRQVHAPSPPKLGNPWTLDLWAVPGPRLVLPWLAGGTARIPVPGLGTFGLDPATLVQLRVESLLQGGKVSLVFPVPSDNALVGLGIAAQSLVWDVSAQRFTGFSNVEVRLIER
jgi:hypothetical protein